MRVAEIAVRSTQRLQLFTQPRRRRLWEVWVVVAAAGRRFVHDHYLTADDLERDLCYARPGDLGWRSATPADVPSRVGTSGFLRGKTIPWDKLLALPAPCDHLASALAMLPCDRRALAIARRAIMGKWTDGAAIVTFAPSSSFRSQPVRVPAFDAGGACPSPDSWSFGRWQLHLTNVRHGCGVRLSVLRLDDEALHVAAPAGRRAHGLVNAFYRHTRPTPRR
jgi:hypothetical protein